MPIILPFLSDGILALGGMKSEGIFRVPGDGDSVSELKLRIDKGYYTLNGFDDPNILASLLKLWLVEAQLTVGATQVKSFVRLATFTSIPYGAQSTGPFFRPTRYTKLGII